MRIAFVTDLHLEAGPKDFHYQLYWQTGHAQIVSALRKFVETNHIDLLLLGGDMTHNCSPSQLATFTALFAPIKVPTILTLGNHDVAFSSDTDHLATWQKALAPFPHIALAPHALTAGDVDIFTINTHWAAADGSTGLYWELGKVSPEARLTDADLAWLDRQLSANPAKPAIFMIHGELNPITRELSGLPGDIHVPAENYVRTLNALLDRHPRVKLVLSGHNHTTQVCWHSGSPNIRRAHLTTGSLSEFPFAARLIETSPKEIRITTHPLIAPPPGLTLEPDRIKPWAPGRDQDRTLSIPLA